jgi:hypothetical protein
MKPNEQTTNRRWGVEQRLEFIEHRLFWEGGINRGDLIEKYGVSVPQASTDIKMYREIAPNNLEYDGVAKRYVATNTFTPTLTTPDAGEYLADMQGSDGDMLGRAYALPFSSLDLPQRLISPVVLRFVIRAIRNMTDIHIRYQSMTTPKPRWRWLAPHALGSDGRRWHFRAFCHIDNQFKDFLFSRILETDDERKSNVSGSDDSDWHETVTVRIAPNSNLPLGQRKVIALDYGMDQGRIDISVRRSMLFYLLKKLDLLGDDSETTPPRLLELRNANEVLSLI